MFGYLTGRIVNSRNDRETGGYTAVDYIRFDTRYYLVRSIHIES